MKRYGEYSRAVKACLMAVLCIGCAPQAAQAQAPGANAPSVDQYVESVPTGSGRSETPSRQTEAAEPLPQRLTERLEAEGGTDASQLEKIATSPALGAPVTQGAGTEGRNSGRRQARGDSGRAKAKSKTTPPTRLSARNDGAVTAVASAASGRATPVLLLLIALVVVTAVIAGAAARARRRTTHDS